LGRFFGLLLGFVLYFEKHVMLEGRWGHSLPPCLFTLSLHGASESDSCFGLEDNKSIACLDMDWGSMLEQRSGFFNEVGRVSTEHTEIKQTSIFLFVKEVLDAVSGQKVDLDVGEGEPL